MKELKSKNTIVNRPSITFIAIFSIAAFATIKNILSASQTIVFLLITSLINFITSFNLFNNFTAKEDYLLISNNWNPLINLKISFSEIAKIECKVANQMGFSILISYLNGEKRFFGVQAKRKDIEDFVILVQENLSIK